MHRGHANRYLSVRHPLSSELPRGEWGRAVEDGLEPGQSCVAINPCPRPPRPYTLHSPRGVAIAMHGAPGRSIDRVRLPALVTWARVSAPYPTDLPSHHMLGDTNGKAMPA